MTKFKIQIDMSEFNEKPLWQDCKDIEFDTIESAKSHIAWMKKEYGEQIEYRISQ